MAPECHITVIIIATKMIQTFIPFYSGNNALYDAKKQISPVKQLEYLKRTVASVKRFSSEIYVGVCTPSDHYQVVEMDVDEVLVKQFDLTDPMRLPAVLLNESKHYVTDYILFSESDQIFVTDPIQWLPKIPGNGCLVAHRWEQHYMREGRDRGPNMSLHGDDFVVINTRPDIPEYMRKFGLYKTRDRYEEYGANFLCHKKLLDQVTWRTDHQSFILESASFDLIDKANELSGWAVKTVDLSGYFVEHLSGRDRHRMAYEERQK